MDQSGRGFFSMWLWQREREYKEVGEWRFLDKRKWGTMFGTLFKQSYGCNAMYYSMF